jgi:hypothetical protein
MYTSFWDTLYILPNKTTKYESSILDHSMGEPFEQNHHSEEVNLCLFTA